MNKVSIILQQKAGVVFTLSKKDTVKTALEIMRDENIGSVLITENEKLIGIFTERDYARKVAFMNGHKEDTALDAVMSTNVITVSPEHSANDCMTLMTERRVRHLPVMEGDKIVGVLSIGDVVKDIIGELEFLCVQLENYIQGLR
ncbi:MAG: CBS domain-containing protein [Anaerolineales bacterium]|nr:CBS domain-containing protein [Anaerolineales bacterium]